MTWDSFAQPRQATAAPMLVATSLSARAMEFGTANLEAALEFAGELSKVKTPMEFAAAVGNELQRRIKAMTEQFAELSKLFGAPVSQKPSDSAEHSENVGFGD